MTETQTYWIIIAIKRPIVINSQLPIYWNKEVAKREAERLGGKISRVTCTWDIPIKPNK